MRCLIFYLLTAVLSAQVRNPYTSREDVAAGARSYRSHCAECHGLKGEGGRGPDLTRGEYRHGSSDAGLFKTIDDGIPGTQMPGIYYEDVQLWQLVVGQGRGVTFIDGSNFAKQNRTFVPGTRGVSRASSRQEFVRPWARTVTGSPSPSISTCRTASSVTTSGTGRAYPGDVAATADP